MLGSVPTPSAIPSILLGSIPSPRVTMYIFSDCPSLREGIIRPVDVASPLAEYVKVFEVPSGDVSVTTVSAGFAGAQVTTELVSVDCPEGMEMY